MCPRDTCRSTHGSHGSSKGVLPAAGRGLTSITEVLRGTEAPARQRAGAMPEARAGHTMSRMSYSTDEETESQSVIQTYSRDSLMTEFTYRSRGGLCTWDKHKRGHLCFLTYTKNKNLGDSHDSHVLSLFFPASRHSKAVRGAHILFLSNSPSWRGHQARGAPTVRW